MQYVSPEQQKGRKSTQRRNQFTLRLITRALLQQLRWKTFWQHLKIKTVSGSSYVNEMIANRRDGVFFYRKLWFLFAVPVVQLGFKWPFCYAGKPKYRQHNFSLIFCPCFLLEFNTYSKNDCHIEKKNKSWPWYKLFRCLLAALAAPNHQQLSPEEEAVLLGANSSHWLSW